MKLEDLLEAPIASLPKGAQSLIAKDMEHISALSMRISNQIQAGKKRAYLEDLEELNYYFKRTMQQIYQ